MPLAIYFMYLGNKEMCYIILIYFLQYAIRFLISCVSVQLIHFFMNRALKLKYPPQ
jgi:hypothetical protein